MAEAAARLRLPFVRPRRAAPVRAGEDNGGSRALSSPACGGHRRGCSKTYAKGSCVRSASRPEPSAILLRGCCEQPKEAAPHCLFRAEPAALCDALKAGLVREIKAKTGMEAWRRDEETGQAYSWKLTDAGLKAIAGDDRDLQSIPSTGVPQNTNEDSSKAKTAANMAAARSATAAPTATAPRQGTKIARVIELLQRDQGAKLEELIAATGWLPHTARAALTGLRHRGYDVRLERGETGRASVYRAVATLAASA